MFAEIDKSSFGTRKTERREIGDFAGRVAGKAIEHGDIRLMFQLPGGRMHMYLSCMWKERTIRFPNRGLWIGDCGLFQ